jgi:cell filamentation protein
MTNRYDISGNPQGQYQPGSNDTVLLNKHSITDPDEMEMLEFNLLTDLQTLLFDEISVDQQISADELQNWHKRWLGDIYEWAGNYRSVNMNKGGFQFAAAHRIPGLMSDYESKLLSRYTPCNTINHKALTEALAVCHVEFILIHPFRDGNGRLGRLLATIMAVQSDMPPLNFDYFFKHKDEYIAAIHAGHAENYGPMQSVFSRVLQSTLEQ